MAYELSKDEIDSIKTAFRTMDQNGDGRISVSELSRTSKTLGFKLSLEEAKALLNEIDDNGDGYLNFKEFENMMREQYESRGLEEQYIKEVFKAIDEDGSGTICLAELSKSLGIPEETARELLDEADDNRDGKIDFKEFKMVYMKTRH